MTTEEKQILIEIVKEKSGWCPLDYDCTHCEIHYVLNDEIDFESCQKMAKKILKAEMPKKSVFRRKKANERQPELF